MSSCLQTDEAVEKEDRIDEMKKTTTTKTNNKTKQKKQQKKQPTRPAPAASTAGALPYAKVVGRPGTGSYSAPSPDPTTLCIAYANNEGSGEPAHPRSLARTFAVHSHKQ